MEQSKSLFVFRRDLRIEDNTALRLAVCESARVLPCFIFDPVQVEEAHPYQSLPGLDFMLRSLEELQDAFEEAGGRLYVFRGPPHEVVRALCESLQINAVYFNRDYTPFSRGRDTAVKKACRELDVVVCESGDVLLQEPEVILKTDGSPYTMFTPFWKNARRLPVPRPVRAANGAWLKPKNIKSEAMLLKSLRRDACAHPYRKGGRDEGLELLAGLKSLKKYRDKRDYPATPATTGLSAHLKFGTLSVREVFHALSAALGKENEFLRQLYWRDFFTHIGWHFPRVFEGAFQSKFDALEWEYNEGTFLAWCEGRTGFPIVDAGMRQLNDTGFMHNRVRLITSSFLTKDLHLSWRLGEQYFARRLIDYDPCVNNGNWQWTASTGCDAQPYFRIFNPWLQQKKFDPECLYIKTWLPELANLSAKEIHNLWVTRPAGLDYPPPLVDHAEASAGARDMYAAVGGTVSR